MRIISYGLGPIGAGIARLCIERGHSLVAAIDIDPEKAGRDLGAVLDGDPLGVTVTADAERGLGTPADIVVHSTRSGITAVLPELQAAVDAGLDVASTCEELAFPWFHHPDEAQRLDAAARRAGATVVGLGVNPGFVMDALPAMLTTPCRDVTAVEVERVVDASLRREPLRRKIGAGLSLDEFLAGVREGRIRHVGLPESVAMLADALGWVLADISEEIEPLLAHGNVAGLHQTARGLRPGQTRAERPAVLLDLRMAVGALNPRDAVTIHGIPTLRLEIPGGIHGDLATWAIVANALPLIREAPPGLLPVTRLPLLHLAASRD